MNNNMITEQDIDNLLTEICDWLFSVGINYMATSEKPGGLRNGIVINMRDAEMVKILAEESGWPVSVEVATNKAVAVVEALVV